MTGSDTRFAEIPGLEGVSLVRHDGPTPTDARHRHDSLCVGAVLAGERALAVADETLTARPGDVLVIGPGRVHACPDRGPSVSVMFAVPGAVTARLGRIPPAGPPFVRRDPTLFGRILRLAALAEAPAPAGERESALLALLDGLGRDGPAPEPEPESGRIQAARALLERRFAESIRLEELAGEAGCSPCRLNRAFARATGLPPHAYQTLLRVREVKRLLRAGASPAEAALDAGFCDQSHMHRCFGRIMGMTPGTYIRGLRRPGRD